VSRPYFVQEFACCHTFNTAFFTNPITLHHKYGYLKAWSGNRKLDGKFH